MSMRRWYFSNLGAWAPLAGLVGSRIRSTGSVGDPARIDRPFVMIRAGSELPQIGNVTQQTFYAYAHVDPASALAADDILAEINAALKAPQYPVKDDGMVVMESRWLGDSDDLFDDVFRTTVRFTTHVITANK